MKNKFLRFWNIKPLGVFIFTLVFVKVLLVTLYEKIISFLWKYNLGSCGSKLTVQCGVSLRFPRNICLGDRVLIGRSVQVFTECADSKLIVGDGSEINIGVELDFSGNLTIGSNVVVSGNAVIMSHDHGFDPHSAPVLKEKFIEDNVWIGQGAIILPQATVIGKNSIVAAGSVVTKNVAENVIVAGNPAKVIRQL